jgi:DNA-binding FadR family transcriptional regulator
MRPGIDLLRKHVVSALSDGSMRRGMRLPGERALAERLGLSRTAVRDALLGLQMEGLVERRHGSGTYIAASSVRSAASTVADVSPAQLMEARLAIEPQFAELVVANATATDLEAIEVCNRRTAQAETSEAFSHWNRRLHLAIAGATRNEFLISVFSLVTQAQQHPAWGELSRQPTTAAMRAAYQREHDEIVAALRARNVDVARMAIAKHLRHARHNLLG